MKKKTLTTSLSMAALVLSLATIPASPVLANEMAQPAVETTATSPLTLELTPAGNISFLVTMSGPVIKENNGSVDLNYLIWNKTTQRYTGTYMHYVPIRNTDLNDIYRYSDFLTFYNSDGEYRVDFFRRGDTTGNILTSVDIYIKDGKAHAGASYGSVTPSTDKDSQPVWSVGEGVTIDKTDLTWSVGEGVTVDKPDMHWSVGEGVTVDKPDSPLETFEPTPDNPLTAVGEAVTVDKPDLIWSVGEGVTVDKPDSPLADFVPTPDNPLTAVGEGVTVNKPDLTLPVGQVKKSGKETGFTTSSKTTRPGDKTTADKPASKPVSPAKTNKSDEKELPKTGDVAGLWSLVGASLLGLAGLGLKKRQ